MYTCMHIILSCTYYKWTLSKYSSTVAHLFRQNWLHLRLLCAANGFSPLCSSLPYVQTSDFVLFSDTDYFRPKFHYIISSPNCERGTRNNGKWQKSERPHGCCISPAQSACSVRQRSLCFVYNMKLLSKMGIDMFLQPKIPFDIFDNAVMCCDRAA